MGAGASDARDASGDMGRGDVRSLGRNAVMNHVSGCEHQMRSEPATHHKLRGSRRLTRLWMLMR